MNNFDKPSFDNLVLHIGLQKTGTTFVQNAVFPHWKGIQYLKGDNLEVLLRSDENRPVLLSREGLSGQNWAHHDVRERSIARFAQLFPNAKIMISFRKHSKYIASSYCQYLQRGGYLPFTRYFDPYGDTGHMKIDDFRFGLKLAAVERHFGRKPFVFFQEEFSGDMDSVLQDMQDFIGGKAPGRSQIRNRRFNQSVKYHPAFLLRFLNKHSKSELNPDGRLPLYDRKLKRLRLDPRSICQYWLKFAPDRPVIPQELADFIDSKYEEDWQLVKLMAEARRELGSSI